MVYPDSCGNTERAVITTTFCPAAMPVAVILGVGSPPYFQSRGPIYKKNLRKNTKFSISFPKFVLSLSYVIQLRFS